ncbi:chaperonin GroEL [Glycomyces dulcitolivorans]|uniref:chaperonin GroEL n=1 Tax=Glycomyces dulcitolivorans TaxID=2200759 RepID=UPI000DD3DA93|nr:chaperonin GroEL [Glycomyces dulcitolivorans]
MGTRRALLVATGSYEDDRWNPLEAPRLDAEALAGVLGDPGVGGYEVTRVVDQPAHMTQRAIHRFLAGAGRDDELLVYFSCHGMKDYDEQLYFAGTDTPRERELLESHAVPAQFVSRHLDRCRARRKVLLLDCCFSGAFRPGAKGGSPAVDFGDPFAGTGTVVISATDETQLAFEIADGGADRLSVFTASIVEGLRSGRADLDGDGSVSAEELYRYVAADMASRDTGQTPKLWLLDGVGSLLIARKAAQEAHRAESAPVRDDSMRMALALMKGISPVAALLSRTLGPSPRPALVIRNDGSMLQSTDAAEIVRESTAPAGPAGIGLGLLRDLVNRVHAVAGDGGATAAVVFESVLWGLLREIERGAAPVALALDADRVFDAAMGSLTSRGKLETKERLAEVVRTGTGDAVIADLIAEAMDKVGKEGVITVEQGTAVGMELELVEGIALDRGFLSSYFVTDEGTGEAVLDLPYLLICTHDITSVEELLPLLERVLQTGRPLLVVADVVGGAALQTLVVNQTSGTFKSVAVRAPHQTAQERAALEDLAVLTGGQVINSEADHRLENVLIDQLGTADRVVVTRDTTTVVGGNGEERQILKRINEIRAEIDRADSPAALEQAQLRLAKLAGGVAIIRVGAYSEAEIAAKSERIRQALRAARLAVGSGVVPGAAAALASLGRAQAESYWLRDANSVVEPVIEQAVRAPLKAILANCGDPDAELDFRISVERWPDEVFDGRSNRLVPAADAGIWDPAGVPWAVLDETAKSVRRFLDLL